MSNIADRVLAELDERGWMQERSYDPATGRMCILGAMERVADGTSRGCRNFVSRFARRYGNVALWNDFPGRTFDQVREALKLVSEDIEIEKEKGIVE